MDSNIVGKISNKLERNSSAYDHMEHAFSSEKPHQKPSKPPRPTHSPGACPRALPSSLCRLASSFAFSSSDPAASCGSVRFLLAALTLSIAHTCMSTDQLDPIYNTGTMNIGRYIESSTASTEKFEFMEDHGQAQQPGSNYKSKKSNRGIKLNKLNKQQMEIVD